MRRSSVDKRDPEVGDERLPLLEQNVLRLDVAMDDATLVRVLKRLRDIARDRDGLVDGNRMLALEERPHAVAIDVGHREPEAATRVARVVDGQDMRMLEARRDADFAAKAIRPERVRDLGAQHLERDQSVVLEVAREEDRRHSAATELVLERIAVRQRLDERRIQFGQRSQRDAGEESGSGSSCENLRRGTEPVDRSSRLRAFPSRPARRSLNVGGLAEWLMHRS